MRIKLTDFLYQSFNDRLTGLYKMLNLSASKYLRPQPFCEVKHYITERVMLKFNEKLQKRVHINDYVKHKIL